MKPLVLLGTRRVLADITGMAKAIIYTRVSTTGQATGGASLDAQQAKARTWAEANGYDSGAVWSDAGISGNRATNRPAFAAALEAVWAERGGKVHRIVRLVGWGGVKYPA